MRSVVLGIDIGGTNTEFGFVTDTGEILAREHVDTRQYATAALFVNAIERKVTSLLEGLEVELAGVGAGAPNANPYTGIVEDPPNLPWKGANPLARLLEEAFKVPALINNDASAAALGERRYGKGRSFGNFIVVTLGTGIGGGIMADGKLVQGRDGLAGEIGHMIAVPGGRLCNCGRKGCFERYASATGLKMTVHELLMQAEARSPLSGIDVGEVSSRRIFEAARQGDKLALEAFDFTGHIIGKVLADVANLFSPERFFFLGGLANAGDLLLNPAQSYFEENVLFIHEQKIKLELSDLPGKDAAMLGSAAMVWETL